MISTEKYISLKERLLACALRARASGLFAGTSGNLSAFDAASGAMLITPSGVRYEEMQPDDLVLVSLSGEVLSAAPERAPSSEAPMHLAIYRVRPDIGGIVHTHSPYATAFAAAGREIPCALIEMAAFLGGDVPLALFAMPGSEALGQSALSALHERSACLLESHGALAVGHDIEQALLRAEYVEDSAKICALAQALGGAKALDERHIEKIRG